MPRRSRLTLADVPVHVIQRGNNRTACFFADEDRLRYLDWLREYALDNACRVHAYILMTNHVKGNRGQTTFFSDATLRCRRDYLVMANA